LRAVAIIPARMASARFPGKPLADIAGKSMIQRVYEQAMQCSDLAAVWVATGDQVIFDHVYGFGGKAILTGEYENGTMRVAAAFSSKDMQADVVVNVQGDQPLIHPEVVSQLIQAFEDPQVQIATLARQSTDIVAFDNPNLVKVSFNDSGNATGFYRTPPESSSSENYFYHIGTYAFRPEVLSEIVALPPAPEEKSAHLEQLRWMYHGYPLQVVVSPFDVDAVDLPGDINRVLAKLG
jgi:3-deoxy-manno-octulosonate cytidylyltransferase (CMP-KDO synthetase)